MEGSRQQVQALSLALIMLLSVVGGSLAFAGSAAATVQDFDGISTSDVDAGLDTTIEQDITLEAVENDGNADTIEISNDASGLDENVIVGPGDGTDGNTRVTTSNGHTASVNEIQTDGTIVVDLGSSSADTADIVVTAELDLGSYQDQTVTYTAESQANSITQETTFDISVARPQFTADDATVPASNPDTIEVQFDEPVATDSATDSNIQSAFTLGGSSGAAIDSFSEIKGANDDIVVLDLDQKVASDITDLTLDYDGSAGSNPIVHKEDQTVTAQDINSVSAVNNALPTYESATVADGTPSQLTVTFSEPVSFDGTDSEIASAFSIDGNSIEGVESKASRSVILVLGSAVTPGADLTTLSYDGANQGEPITADTGENDPVFDFQDRTVSNDVIPSIKNAEVTAASPGEILLTYDAEIESAGGDVTAFTTVDGTIAAADFTAGDSTQVALEFDSTTIEGGDGSLNDLSYDTADGDNSAVVQTVSETAAQDTQTGITVNNNVAPTYDTAEVTNDNPGQVRVTFSEAVVADVGTGNINSAVTDAFDFSNANGVDYRVKNVETNSLGSSTIVLNLGLEDGTSQEVEVGDDLTDVLSYDPSAPSGDETDPLVADGSASPAAQGFTDEDVTNNVDTDFSTAEVTINGDELRVTFTEDVNQVGTDSEIVDAFSVGSDAITLDPDSFDSIENGDTVVFSGYSTSSLTSGSDLGEVTASNGITYDASAGTNPLEIDVTEESVSDFAEETITNNIQPTITDAEVTNADPGQISVTYSENIQEDGDIAGAFSLDGPDAPSIDSESVSGKTLTLTLGSDVSAGDNLGTLTYDAGTSNPVISDNALGAENAVALDGDSATDINSVGSTPVLQSVTIDDAAANNGGSSGEMLLAFNQDVTTGGTDASGLSFDSGTTEASVSIDDDGIDDDETDSPGHVVIVSFTSDSGSASSNIQQGDSLSDASLTVDDAGSVSITADGNTNNIAKNTVTDVRNEIAGELATVQSIEIDTELIGTEVDATGDFTVTVTGLRDANGNRVIDDTVQVDIGGAADSDLVDVTPDRFSDSAKSTETPTGISKSGVEIGSEATVDVDGADVTDAATVTYVHEAFAASEGYQLTSQPMPGEFVAGEGVTDVSYYDADASAFASYGSEGEVQDVHNALFVHAESADAEYGFAYDEDRSGQQTNVGDVTMSEGWHIVGSNYDIDNNGNDLDLSVDLGTQNPPSSAAVQVQLESLPGSTLADDATVGSHGVYYVFLHQQDNRPIVLPAYSGTNTASEDTSA